ncbi:Formyltransferase/hydrolase complex subunit D [Rubripirellula tenax]|uniref:Formylmethanofuran--tetrahydromethanopterin formyltransferase n=2 Tax=Rubripirellula tenax TaxID=2528015 RepID=A0A5C6FLH6_9BACT|nr:Formyltransferase/hydrolase complex subunit D [Rubripirellula tenax]
MLVNGIPIESEFAEAFDMKATRVIITGHDRQWALDGATAMTGFGTSVIACGIETAIERELSPDETPDGRPGFAILAFAVSGAEMEKQIPRRAGQCVLTCPTSAIYAGILGDKSLHPKRIPLGKMIRYFGDGHQISKVTPAAGYAKGRRFWRVPVMDGEFVCEHDVGRVDGIGGGNFLLLGDSVEGVSIACRAAVAAMSGLPDVITPFPGGAARSGSKVGSKYPALFASTNDAFCPTLRTATDSLLRDGETAALEIVIDGLSFDAIANSMKVGITAACEAAADKGLLRVTAGNYGGKLGKHHFHLAKVMQ